MEYRHCQPPCAHFIAREDPHRFSHARDVVYGTSKCKICEDFRLITLRSRLEACEKESSVFPRRAPGTSAASREIAASASREATTWGSEAVGSCTLPSGASLNPGVWLMQLTQLTALLVQCWSFCKKG